MDITTTAARMCDCGNDTVIPGTRLCKECAWAGRVYPHLFPEDALNAEIDRLRTENTRLNAVNAAQSDMLKGAALAAAEVTQERDNANRRELAYLAAARSLLFELSDGMIDEMRSVWGNTNAAALLNWRDKLKEAVSNPGDYAAAILSEYTEYATQAREYAELCADADHA